MKKVLHIENPIKYGQTGFYVTFKFRDPSDHSHKVEKIRFEPAYQNLVGFLLSIDQHMSENCDIPNSADFKLSSFPPDYFPAFELSAEEALVFGLRVAGHYHRPLEGIEVEYASPVGYACKVRIEEVQA